MVAVLVEDLGPVGARRVPVDEHGIGYLATPSAITWLFGSSHGRGTDKLTNKTLSTPESVRIIWSNSPLVKVPLLPRWTTTTSPSCPEARRDFRMSVAV